MFKTVIRLALLATLVASSSFASGCGPSSSLPMSPSSFGARADMLGVIASLNTGAGTLVVNGTTVKVSASTAIRRGSQNLQLADLKVGGRVHVLGVRDNSTVAASEVDVEAPGDTGPNVDHQADGQETGQH